MSFAEAMATIQQASPQVGNELTPTNTAAAKKAFLASRARTIPEFTYDESTDYDDASEKLRWIMDGLKREDFSEVQWLVLEATAARALDEYALLAKVREYRHQERKPGRTEGYLAQFIRQTSERLWGAPDEAIYRELWQRRLDKLDTILRQSEFPAVDMEKLHFLKERFSRPEKCDKSACYQPQPLTVEVLRHLFEAKWQKSLDRIDPERTENYTPEEVCDLMNAIFQEDYPYPVKWKAVISENKTSLDANQITKELEIPRRRGQGPYTREVVREKATCHENGVHIAREAYAHQYCPSLAVRLPGYLDFEEGLAKAVEQALSSTGFEQAGIEHYLTVGMAYFDKMSFSEIFQVHHDLRFLKTVKSNDDDKVRATKSQMAADEAFRLTMRCLRGTSEVPQTVNLTYYVGQAKAWKYIEDRIDQPERLWKALFENGKTDLTDPLHCRLLLELGHDCF